MYSATGHTMQIINLYLLILLRFITSIAPSYELPLVPSISNYVSLYSNQNLRPSIPRDGFDQYPLSKGATG